MNNDDKGQQKVLDTSLEEITSEITSSDSGLNQNMSTQLDAREDGIKFNLQGIFFTSRTNS